MIRPIALIAALLAPVPALALSCLPYSHTQAFLDADASADNYLVVLGRLDFDSGNLPRTDGVTEARGATFSAQATGNSLSYAGFITPFRQSITVHIDCAGVWCGGLEAGHRYLMFLRQTGGGYRLDQMLCETNAFYEPTPDMEADIVTCMQGGPCAPAR